MAVSCKDDGKDKRGLLTSIKGKKLTVDNWKCTNTMPVGDTWKQTGFDDSMWVKPDNNGKNYAVRPWGQIKDIINESQWMWVGSKESSDGGSDTIWCRLTLP